MGTTRREKKKEKREGIHHSSLEKTRMMRKEIAA